MGNSKSKRALTEEKKEPKNPGVVKGPRYSSAHSVSVSALSISAADGEAAPRKIDANANASDSEDDLAALDPEVAEAVRKTRERHRREMLERDSMVAKLPRLRRQLSDASQQLAAFVCERFELPYEQVADLLEAVRGAGLDGKLDAQKKAELKDLCMKGEILQVRQLLHNVGCPVGGETLSLADKAAMDAASKAAQELEERHARSLAEVDAAMQEFLANLPDAFTKCPRCDLVVEKVRGDPKMEERATANISLPNGAELGRAAAVKERCLRRFRCAGCSAEYCECGESPYHFGFTCAGYAAYLGKDKCRYCDRALDKGSKKGARVCGDQECAEKGKDACPRVLDCGHQCFGMKHVDAAAGTPAQAPAKAPNATKRKKRRQRSKGSNPQGAEEGKECSADAHAPCFCLEPGCQGAAEKDEPAAEPVSGGDLCAVCWVEELREKPCVRLECGHVFHGSCIKAQIEGGFPGPRITFGFMGCPLCKAPMETHPWVKKVAESAVALRVQVHGLVQQRLVEERKTDRATIVRSTLKERLKGEKLVNSEGRAVARGRSDYDKYYCGGTGVGVNCKCKRCKKNGRDQCGPDSGCMCKSCEEFTAAQKVLENKHTAAIERELDEESGPVGNVPAEDISKGAARMAFYKCGECKTPFYGGEARCADMMEQGQGQSEAGGNNDPDSGRPGGYNASELLCNKCGSKGVEKCEKHGEDFVSWKCHSCCVNVSAWNCGGTHWCSPCHDDICYRGFSGGAKPCPGKEGGCMYGGEHPSGVVNGEGEHCLGCTICRPPAVAAAANA